MATAKLSEQYIAGLPFCEGRQTLVYDSVTQGFGIRVSGRRKVFFAEKRLQGSGATRRRTIGPSPAIKVADARREAYRIISELSRGIDVKEEQARCKTKAISLKTLFESYVAARPLKPKTEIGYRNAFESAFPDWGGSPWTSLSAQKILKRHQDLSTANGPAYANLSFRVLNAIVQFGIDRYRAPDDSALLNDNPVGILTRAKAWNKVKPRSSYVKPQELKGFWEAVEKLESATGKDLLKVLILTGLRRGEASGLKWEHVDLALKKIEIPDTKNGKPHVLPLSQPLMEIFERRSKPATSAYVFPGADPEKHYCELKRSVAQVIKKSGLQFSPHDLRRSFAVYGETLELSGYTIKRLLNHSSGGDVTMDHYLPLDVERLRKPMERIAEFVMGHAGKLQGEKVLQLPLAASAA
jgi:integrase